MPINNPIKLRPHPIGKVCMLAGRHQMTPVAIDSEPRLVRGPSFIEFRSPNCCLNSSSKFS